jgi:6-phosphogluconolactonase
LGMKTADAMPQTAVAQINERYSSLVTPFALTLLGMGPDGHTASLFPDAEGLTEALAPNAPMCAAIRAVQSDVTGPLVDRMTLTLSAILNSQRVILLITGEEKLAVYQRAKTASDIQAQPVAAVLQQAQVPVDVYWAK